jgi:hypothetical protein
MAVIVKLWGIYDGTTADGMVGVGGVGFDSAGNGTFSLFKRHFGIGLSRLF